VLARVDSDGAVGMGRDRQQTRLDKTDGTAVEANDNEKWMRGDQFDAVTLSDDQVARVAARFIASHGMKVESMSDELREIAATIPVGRPDLLQHWQSVARRIGKIVAASLHQPH
jgi:hypothetical protein